MQAIVATVGTTGDILPAISIARLLAARGHDVRLIANAAFANLASTAGIPFNPVGDARHLREAFHRDELWDNQTGFRLFAGSVMLPAIWPMAAAIRSAAERAPSFVVAFTFALGAIMAGRQLRVPTARIVLSPAAADQDSRLMRNIALATQLVGVSTGAQGIGARDLNSHDWPVPSVVCWPRAVSARDDRHWIPLRRGRERSSILLATVLGIGCPAGCGLRW